MTPEELALETKTGDDKIIGVAKARWERCKEWQSTADSRWTEDQKFAHADPENGYQWPSYLWAQARDDATGYKPRLTVNKTRQHNLQIKNDNKQNRPGIKISPVGENATFQAAKIWAGLVRHIERISKAGDAYATASDFQVDCGIGYIRVVTDFVDGTFDQEVFIRRVKNPRNVFLDPDHNEIDGSDSNFCFIFDDRPKVEFLEEYPEMRGKVSEAALGNSRGWIDQDHVRMAEYFCKRLTKDKLVLLRNPQATSDDDRYIIARWNRIPARIRRMIDKDDILKSREFLDQTFDWYKIAGNDIVERGEWPSRYIPIVPVIGEETIIDGMLDRKGHTRYLKDVQRMYNFWTSSAVEHVALQTKSKWFVPVGATENLETYYRTLNTTNYPYIPWNAFDTEGNQLPAPIPIEPPTMGQGFIQGMQIAQNEFMISSGQREENFGQPTNAISSLAIEARERKGDNATYHFIDGLAIGVRQVGNIILDIAPKIYKNRQIKQILAEDGSEQLIRIDPTADVAYAEEPGGDDQTWVIFNPKIGRYWVDSDVGPSYATKRQEAWNAFVQITTANQQLVTVIGDLMFRNADFPGADEIADRLKRLVPPQATGDGPPPDLLEAQKQNQALQGLLADMTEKLAKQEIGLKDKGAKLEIERRDVDRKMAIEQMNADTNRLRASADATVALGGDQLRPVIEQMIRTILAESGAAGSSARAPEQPAATPQPPVPTNGAGAAPGPAGQLPEEEPPVPGARKAPDGKFYVPDGARPGKYLRVEAGG